MNTNMAISITLDVLVLALVFFPVAAGIRKGLVRRLVSIAVLIAAAAAGYFGSAALTPSVYDEYLRDRVQEVCLRKAEQFDPVRLSSDALAQYGIEMSEDEIRQAVAESADAVHYAESLAEESGLDRQQLEKFSADLSEQLLSAAPESVKAAVPEVVPKLFGAELSNSEAFEVIQAAARSPEDAAVYAEEHYARPLIESVLRMGLFAAITLLVRLVLSAIFALILRAGGSTIETADRIQGGLLGAAQGALEVGLLILIVHSAESMSDGRFAPQNLGSVVFLPVYKLFFN